jgi:hypothetical protein
MPAGVADEVRIGRGVAIAEADHRAALGVVVGVGNAAVGSRIIRRREDANLPAPLNAMRRAISYQAAAASERL